jgi:biopolymer transport protein ExbD
MTRDSVLYLNDKKIDPKDLMDSLKLTFAEDPYKLLVVRADREVKYLNVLDILTACRLAGAQRMACATVLDTARVYREDTGHAHQ